MIIPENRIYAPSALIQLNEPNILSVPANHSKELMIQIPPKGFSDSPKDMYSCGIQPNIVFAITLFSNISYPFTWSRQHPISLSFDEVRFSCQFRLLSLLSRLCLGLIKHRSLLCSPLHLRSLHLDGAIALRSYAISLSVTLSLSFSYSSLACHCNPLQLPRVISSSSFPSMPTLLLIIYRSY